MGETYFNLVIVQKRTCDVENKTVKQVPGICRGEVITILTERGYDLNGFPLHVI